MEEEICRHLSSAVVGSKMWRFCNEASLTALERSNVASLEGREQGYYTRVSMNVEQRAVAR
jgi:hypothetical protein